MFSGCGDQYRPVLSATNPVGPAAQPAKYAVAVSSASATSNGLLTLVDFSGDSTLITATLGVNPYYFNLSTGGTTGFTLNSDGSLNSFDVSTSLLSNEILTTTLLPCSPNTVVTCGPPVPKSSLPTSIIATNTTEYLTQPGRAPAGGVAILQGVPPSLVEEQATGYAPLYTVLQASSQRVYVLSKFSSSNTSPGTATAIETNGNTISNVIPVGTNPLYGIMSIDNNRTFVLNNGSGTISVINSQENQLDSNPALAANSTIAVGSKPVWADIYYTGAELFVASQGSNTTTDPASVNIINTALCNTTTNIGGDVITAAINSAGTGYSVGDTLTLVQGTNTTAQLGVTAISGGGKTGPIAAVTIINPGTLYTSPATLGVTGGTGINASFNITATVFSTTCNATDPTDSTQFGQIIAKVPLTYTVSGVTYNHVPTEICVLQDGSKAYVANQDPSLPNGSVSSISLTTFTVLATIPVSGHPTSLACTAGNPTGKVYVTAPDSTTMSIISSQIDQVTATTPLQGYGVMVRVTSD